MENVILWYSCDNCNPEADPKLPAYFGGGNPDPKLRDRAKEEGWTFKDDGDFCPSCSAQGDQLEESLEPEDQLTGELLRDTPDFGEVDESIRDDRPAPEQETVFVAQEESTPAPAKPTVVSNASLKRLGDLFKKSK